MLKTEMVEKHQNMSEQTGQDNSNASLLTFVISFPEDTDRRAIITERLSKQGITPTFIDAVDGRALSDAAKQQYLDPKRQEWLPRRLSAGALGCSLAHMKAWRALLDSNADCALILEDDAVLADNANDILRIVTNQMNRFEIITLHHYKKRPVHVIENLTADHALAVVRYNQIGAIAYILDRHAADRLLGQALPIRFELDVYMNRWWQHGVSNLLIYPPIAKEDGRDSSIGYRHKEPEWPDDTFRLRLRRRLNRVRDSLQKRLRFRTYVTATQNNWQNTKY